MNRLMKQMTSTIITNVNSTQKLRKMCSSAYCNTCSKTLENLLQKLTHFPYQKVQVGNDQEKAQ